MVFYSIFFRSIIMFSGYKYLYMPKTTTTRKRVKSVKRRVNIVDSLSDITVEKPDKNWDLDFKINEEYKLTPNQVEFLVKALSKLLLRAFGVMLCFVLYAICFSLR